VVHTRVSVVDEAKGADAGKADKTGRASDATQSKST